MPRGKRPPPEFRLCVMKDGNHDCPSFPDDNWPDRTFIYESEDIDDGRVCLQECTCGPPTGSMCVAQASVYQNSDNTCAGPTVANLDHVGLSSLKPTCNDINPPGQPLGSKSATPPTYIPGGCTAIEGQSTGHATGTNPTTLCCKPAEFVP